MPAAGSRKRPRRSPSWLSGEGGWVSIGTDCGRWRGFPSAAAEASRDSREHRRARSSRETAAIAAPASSRRPRTRRRWLRILLLLPVLFVVVTALQVAVLRFVDPPTSAFMPARPAQAWGEGEWGYRVAYDWRDMEAIAASLPMSVIAAEDQNFAHHPGFDLEAIGKAMDSNARGGRVRGGSTISQQVAKNLFLWQGRSW